MKVETASAVAATTKTWTRRAMLGCCALSAVAMAITGCGGGSNDNGGTDTRVATLTGKVIDINNNDSPIEGVVVTLNGASATTGVDGTFSLKCSAFTTSKSGFLAAPKAANGTDRFYRSGYLGGELYDFVSDGFPAAPIQANETRTLGTFKLGNTDGPPFPPKI